MTESEPADPKASAVSLRRALRLTIVTDAAAAAPRSVTEIVREAIEAGARVIQLRNKGATARELLAAGEELRDATRLAGALLIVNDRLDVALALEADGVHLGPDDLPVAAVRALVPSPFVVGRSADSPDLARAAVADGADYIGCGTVYATRTKPDAGAVVGLAGLDAVARAVRVPVVAIGGVSVPRAEEVARTRAAGVAVVAAVMGSPEVANAVRGLLGPFEAREVGRDRR